MAADSRRPGGVRQTEAQDLDRFMQYYDHYRVFCSTTLGEEEEREVFSRVLAEVNEAVAMPCRNLLVPVSLVPRMVNKQIYQSAVDENIREATFYVQVLADTWGPRERNLHRDYQLACRCLEDEALPMREVLLAAKTAAKPDPDVVEFLQGFAPAPHSTFFGFADLSEFELHLKCLLVEWAQSLPVRSAVTSA